VYSQASAKSRVLRTLEQDDRVLIDMTISASEGTWCLVRDPGGKEKPGYIPCSQLTSEAMPKPAPTVPVFNAPETALTSSSSVQGASGQDPLALSEEQKAAYQQLLESSGLESLRDELAATYRRYGVTNISSLMERMSVAARRPYGDSFFAAVEPKIRIGGARYKAFWKAYWSLLTPDQKNLLPKRNPGFLLAYLNSQSDPETAFDGWVLASIERTQKK
jgi:hypothetical protein